MIKILDKFSLFGPAGNRRVQSRLQDQFGLLERIQLPKVPEELKESDVPRQVQLAEATEHTKIGLPTICQPQFVKFLPHLYDWLTMHPARIVAETLTEHSHQDAQQTVPNSA